MSKQHTPGPWDWSFGTANTGTGAMPRHLFLVTRMANPPLNDNVVLAVREDWVRAVNDSPDARLITAAPDYHTHAYHLAMLVLQSLLYKNDPDVREQVDNVLALHARVEGI